MRQRHHAVLSSAGNKSLFKMCDEQIQFYLVMYTFRRSDAAFELTKYIFVSF